MPANNSGGKGRGAPKASVKRSSAYKATSNTKYGISQKALRKNPKKKSTGVKKTPRVARLTKISSMRVMQMSRMKALPQTDTSTSTLTGKKVDVAEVKREALNMDLSIVLADEQAMELNAPKDLWKEVSSWAKLASVGNPEYASRLRFLT